MRDACVSSGDRTRRGVWAPAAVSGIMTGAVDAPLVDVPRAVPARTEVSDTGGRMADPGTHSPHQHSGAFSQVAGHPRERAHIAVHRNEVSTAHV
ncbi:hypothetical protein GCM10010345_71510 [Streptomyces canarius]|uniref:Uncharacterized protein n=1 Tax=Streptomyces canarius TaxID=285453 RepID=A0ABQ3D4U6_9ACTN|nr:hypothetical protein GCM10010345_71510 [Streptomyces canarius]